MLIRLAMVMMRMILMMMMMNFECSSFCEARFQNFCSVFQFGNFVSKIMFFVVVVINECLLVSCLFSRKRWLKETGSPKSRIDRCEFKNERTITKLEFSDFAVRK